MEIAHILYLVISISGSNVSVTSLRSEHDSKSTCETAATIIRQTLADGKVILARCTPK